MTTTAVEAGAAKGAAVANGVCFVPPWPPSAPPGAAGAALEDGR
ncbi:MAG TPA: hypothetical protein VF244_10590 [Acidimicrobiales bacterium]